MKPYFGAMTARLTQVALTPDEVQRLVQRHVMTPGPAIEYRGHYNRYMKDYMRARRRKQRLNKREQQQ